MATATLTALHKRALGLQICLRVPSGGVRRNPLPPAACLTLSLLQPFAPYLPRCPRHPLQTSDRPSTLSFYMTLRPRLAAPTGELEERVTSGEQEEVNRHTQRWLAALLARPDCRSRVHKVRAG